MKQIKLTQDQVALVGDADYDWLNQHKWRACNDHQSGAFYAVRKSCGGKGLAQNQGDFHNTTRL